MANIIYNKFIQLNMSGQLDLDAAGTVLRILLERSTSTYVPNKDHDFLDSFTTGGGIEITVASYSRKTLATKAVNLDDLNDRSEFDCDDIAFGALESGQTADAIIIYQQIGGDDTTPADDPIICYIDTATGLPLVLNGGTVTITINAEGLLQAAQP